MVYRRFQTRRDKEGVTSLYKGRAAGSTLVVAVVEFKDMLTIYDNGEDGSRAFPDRMLRTGGRGEVTTYLARFGIHYTTPETQRTGEVLNMKKLMCVLLLFLVGCAQDPVQRTSSNNPNIAVDTLFTHEGCTVYRFVDDGRYHYYAACHEKQASTTTQQQAGKTTYNEEIHTATK